MPATEQKGSLLAAFSPWSTPRSSTPQPAVRDGTDGKVSLQQHQIQGEDHVVNRKLRITKRQYPKDCPPLKVRWFYAVDSPKRKPAFSGFPRKDAKPLPAPKKFVAFSVKDSQSIETAFQRLADLEEASPKPEDVQNAPTRVPVNEDYLFDVDVVERELLPAYWLGPVYEVRRGTWFFQEGASLRPCDENLATQLEEGFLKMRPWQPHDPDKRPATPDSTKSGESAPVEASPTSTVEPLTYRLFGAYMNSTVTYQDSSTAWLNYDDLLSRMSSTVYQKFGAVGGTKIIRGYMEAEKSRKSAEAKATHSRTNSGSTTTKTSAPSGGTEKPTSDSRPSSTASTVGDSLKVNVEQVTDRFRRPMLERQLSSLVGEPQDSDELEAQAREQEEKEMEDLRDVDEDRDREIDHLILVTHGIGQRLGLRAETLHFIHDVNTLRKTLKAVYKVSPDLQALNYKLPDSDRNCRVQVLPVCWRYLLDFPYRGYRQNQQEADIVEGDEPEETQYPSLTDITLEGVPVVRNLISDLAMDVLLYQSDYRQHIARIVQQECNRILKLYKERNPSFKGSVSLCGHSLGSAILFDILCSQQGQPAADEPQGKPEQPSKFHVFPRDIGDLPLDFDCNEFFCLGSPIALFQMIKGNRIAGRSMLGRDSTTDGNDLAIRKRGASDAAARGAAHRRDVSVTEVPANLASPKCGQLYNIFHPSDPVSYRIEPLIAPAMAKLKPQPLPWVKKSLWAMPGQSFSMIGSRVGSLWSNFTSGVASSLLNRSLGLSSEDSATPQTSAGAANQPDPVTTPLAELERQIRLDGRPQTLIEPELETLYGGFQRAHAGHSKSDSVDSVDSVDAEDQAKKMRLEDAKVRALNLNGRVDYSVQEGAFDISLIASIASHLSYWGDEDVNHFMLSQMLSRRFRQRALEASGSKT